MSGESWTKSFPEWIEPLVARRGSNYTDLADRAGMSYSWLRKVAQGSARPSAKVVVSLARALDCTPEERDRGMVAAGYSPEEGVVATRGEEEVALPRNMKLRRLDLTVSVTFRRLGGSEFAAEIRVVRESGDPNDPVPFQVSWWTDDVRQGEVRVERGYWPFLLGKSSFRFDIHVEGMDQPLSISME